MNIVSSAPPKHGAYVAFTGIDGAGKSTQAGKLAFYIQNTYGPTYLAESRTDFISKLLHSLAAKHGKVGRREYFGDHVVDFSKAFDVVRDHYANIAPLLASGMHVVEPRSVYCRSAMAFAMTGVRDKKTEQVLALIPRPDLLFWIDTSPKVAYERVQKRGIDVEALEDLKKFSRAFRTITESDQWIRVHGDSSKNAQFRVIRKHADTLFAP